MTLQTDCPHHSPRVSIITTTLNAVDARPLTIASLRAQQDRGFEWIVVDGGSSDGTVACLAAARDVVTTVLMRSGAGVADGWNTALEHASGRWLLFLHHRSLFEAGERFDLRYWYAPDTDFLLRQRFLFVPQIVKRMEFGGISGQLINLRAVSREMRHIAERYGFHPPMWHRCTQHIKLWIADRFAQFLPVSMLRLIERRWRRWRAFNTTRRKDTKS